MSIYKQLGQSLVLTANGKDPEEISGRMEAFDVSSSNSEVRQSAIEFYKSASAYIAKTLSDTVGETPEYYVFTKLATATDWYPEMSDIVDEAFAGVLEKNAASLGAAAVPMVVGKSVQYAPILLKSLLALGVTGGAAAGSLYWGLNRHINEDSDDDNEVLKAKISEYDRMQRLLHEDMKNKKIKTVSDIKNVVSAY